MYERILVPVDGSPTADAGLTEAIRLAKLTGGQLRLLHVIDPPPFVFSGDGYGAVASDVLAVFQESGRRVLEDARKRVVHEGVAVDTAISDSFGERLCERAAQVANEWKADLIVIGTHGRRGVSRALLGSDAEQVLRTAPVPVLLVRAAEPQTDARKA
jgi:nucleotide-binding universal stress UspA family protein